MVVKNIKGGTKGKIINLMLAGYFLDECESFYYIGENQREVFACVKKEEIASIMMGDASEEGLSVPEGHEVQ
jgi:endo-alpha-1,4-polygalactosaminidase (GH114 family)